MEEIPSRIKALKKRIHLFKGQNTAVKTFLTIYNSKEIAKEKISHRINKYNDIFATFDETFDQLEELDPDNEEHSPEIRHELETNYYANQAEYERILATARGETPRATSSASLLTNESNTQSYARRRLKLPESSLPTFSGEYENWLSFKGEFEATIHNQDDVSKVDKLAYLRRAMQGQALDKIKMIAITEENYDRAWNILNEVYSNNRLIMSRHLKLLLGLPVQSVESANGLTKLVDHTRQHLEMLRMMGVEVTDQVIVALLETKLHQSTNEAWEDRLKKAVYPKAQELLEFLSERATRLIGRGTQTATHKSEGNSSKQGIKRSHAKAFYSATDKKCPICNEDQHPLFKCQKFRKESVTNRIKLIKEHGFCHNCLRGGHEATDCNSKRMCWVCDGRHNTLIHEGEQCTKNKGIDRPHQD